MHCTALKAFLFGLRLQWLWLVLAVGGLAIYLANPAMAVESTTATPSNASAQWQKTVGLMAWLPQQTQPVWLSGNAASLPKKVPLGSLWKLLVYSYSLDTGLADKPYQCKAGNQAQQGDEYCCSQTQTIWRDTALARSCGQYFTPSRLGINALDWQRYWQAKLPQVAWLQQLSAMQPSTQTTPSELLLIVRSLPKPVVQATRDALLGRILQPQWSALLPYLGGAYRFKTFTWQHPQYVGASFGGAVGFLADGTVFWVGGSGSSKAVLLRAAPILSQQLPINQHYQRALADDCVMVRFFKRYPIASINAIASQQAVHSGTLKGQYTVRFNNKQVLPIRSMGELFVTTTAGQPTVWGKLDQQDYIARVLDREADAKQHEAAKALSIAARSYLRQNAYYHQGCWQIDDDSSKQRVSASPASIAAQRIAAFTEGLTLAGSPIFYHKQKAATNTLSWQQAVAQAQQGQDYLAILRGAYPSASFVQPASAANAGLSMQTVQCKPLPEAQAYIRRRIKQAQPILRKVAGLEAVGAFKVCQLDYGNPYSDAQMLNIYVRNWQSLEGRTTLMHEYLHLALRFHPNGQREDVIEALARQLASVSLVNASTHQPTLNKPASRIHHAQ